MVCKFVNVQSVLVCEAKLYLMLYFTDFLSRKFLVRATRYPSLKTLFRFSVNPINFEQVVL